MVNPLAALIAQIEAGDVVLAVVLVLLVLWAVGRALALRGVVSPDGRVGGFCRLAWQIGALLGLEQAYEVTRGHIIYTQSSAIAFLHAYRVFDFELHHGLFIEQRLQHMVLGWGPVMTGVDYFYVFAHVGVTIGVLIWVYVRHRSQYPFVRNLLMVTTAVALVVFYAYPTAPPRFLTPLGFVDPATTNHLVDAGGAQPNSYTYNPFAAMPSLHVAYALVAAWGTVIATRRTWLRVAAVLYPFGMTFTVLASANHWVLDIIGAVVTVAGSAGIVAVLGVAGSGLHTAFSSRPRVSSSLIDSGASLP